MTGEADADGDKTRGDSPRAFSSGADPSGSTSLLSTDALKTERGTQRRTALAVATVLSGIGVLALQFALAKPLTHWLLTAMLTVTCAVSGMSWLSARGARWAPSASALANGVLVTLSALAAVAHVGPLSAVACVLPIIIYYFAFGDSVAKAVWLFALTAVGYALVVGLASAGLVPLRDSLVELAISKMNVPALAMLGGFVEVVLIATYFMGRRTRRAALAAMEELEAARLRVEQRDALLEEAHADLDRAMEAGRFGRLSGTRVGAWLVDDVIGRGGMSEIYRAVHASSGEAAAMKVLHSSVLGEPTHVERFFREARVSSGLSSPHVVKVLDSGYAADGTPYLAMELLQGADLSRLLRERSRMSSSEVLELVSHASHALTTAHEAGIVHRDLKPQNLFLAEDAANGPALWRVLDFGISKIAEAGGTLTHGGAVVGTPRYMSPEQARGHAVDRRSDVFSLGVVAYRALTGRPPFAGHDSMATMYQVMHVQPANPADYMTEHGDVELALAMVLAKDRARRFQTVAEFSHALAAAVRGELEPRLRDAARALLADQPWGSEVRARA
ncbi:MAG: serine/threonine protein kinase [Myxococcales bacterium]|nr:serine/threonine protein kinase [Myxococcales bacterium]